MFHVKQRRYEPINCYYFTDISDAVYYFNYHIRIMSIFYVNVRPVLYG